ncbi:MAG: cobalamin-binding protein [Thaumarchaeota archaeon]|nr:cobalamin-binding protein [Nitrososphaerota archaeon]
MENRIVSFLPSATEILYDLGVGDSVLAVTHECNYPPEARSKPKVIRSVFDPQKMSSQEIDRQVADLVRNGSEIYVLDEAVLREANPDIIIAQGICEVCSPFTREIDKAVGLLGGRPEVITLNPRTLDGILDSISEVGARVGRLGRARSYVSDLRGRIKKIQHTPKGARPKVLCIEWLDPLYTAGHWVPQMVEIAGGINGLSTTGGQSRRMELDEAARFDPDVIVLMPCGFDVGRTLGEYESTAEGNRWRSLRAVREGQVYAVNANEYFSRPGPRTVTGLEILAKIINPDTFRDLHTPKNSVKKVEPEL